MGGERGRGRGRSREREKERGRGEKKSDCTYTGAALSQGIITWK